MERDRFDPLDLTEVLKEQACLEPVRQRFMNWFNKFAPQMSHEERVECQWSIDKLRSHWTQLGQPSDNMIYRQCLGKSIGRVKAGTHHVPDLSWCHFFILRLLYVDCHEEVVARKVRSEGIAIPNKDLQATVGGRFLRCGMAQLIKERYGDGIDLGKEEYPGPIPPRPSSWLLPGQNLTANSTARAPKEQSSSKKRSNSDRDDEDETFDSTGVSMPALSPEPRRSKRARTSSQRHCEVSFEDIDMNNGTLVEEPQEAAAEAVQATPPARQNDGHGRIQNALASLDQAIHPAPQVSQTSSLQ